MDEGKSKVRFITHATSFALLLFMLFPVSAPYQLSALSASLTTADVRVIFSAINHSRVQEHLRYLSGLGSRVTGYPGCVKASSYIENALASYGLRNITRFTYNVTVPIDYGANLTVLEPNGGRSFSIYALVPNMVQTCPTPPDGIEGHLIYAGDGKISSFNGKTVKGSIVLMDFNTGDNWKNAQLLGAKAVLFIEPENTFRSEAEKKFVNIPLNFPRFWVTKRDAWYLLNLLEMGEVRVNIKSNMQYEIVQADHIYGFIDGMDPTLKDEIIVLTAHYDSWSVAPSLAPGANDAVGIVTLLELASFFREYQPKRTVMFLALSGHHQSLEGSRQFIEEMYWGSQLLGPPKEWWVLKTKFFIGLDLCTLSNSIDAPLAAGWRYYWRVERGLSQGAAVDAKSKSYDCWELLSVEALFKSYRTEIYRYWQSLYGTIPADIEIYGNLGDDEYTSTRSIGPYFFAPIVLTIEAFWWPGPTSWSYATIKHMATNLETPLDTYDRLNLENLWPQLEWIFYSLNKLVNEVDLGLTYKPELEGGAIKRYGMGSNFHWAGFSKVHGIAVTYNTTTAGYDPLPDALVFVYLKGASWAGFIPCAYKAMEVVKADKNGKFTLLGWGSVTYAFGNMPGALNVDVYVLNSTGHILYAPDLGECGGRTFPFRGEPAIVQAEIGLKENPYRFTAFQCASIYMPHANNPNSGGIGIPEVLDIAHAPARFYGYALYDSTVGDIMVYIQPDIPFEILVRQQGGEPLIILMNLQGPQMEGPGYTLREGEVLNLTPEDYARQFYYLNDARAGRTKEYGISSPATSDRLLLAEKYLWEAEQAYASRRYDKWLANSIFAWSVVREAWQPARMLFDDIVRSIVLFFALLLPFVLVLEKLTLDWQGLNRKLIAILFFFIAFSLGFSYLHPGFGLASNIFGVLVGFVGTMLCLPIILLFFGEVKATLKQIQAKLLGYTASEVEIVGATTSAISIGVTHMRKRKLRTILTMFSVAIVVYAMIMTSSVAPITKYITIDTGTPPSYTGMLIVLTTPEAATGKVFGQPQPLDPELLKLIKYDLDNIATISKRARFSPGDVPGLGSRYISIIGPNGSFDAFTCLGLSPEELEVSLPKDVLIEGRWFESGDFLHCILSAERAKELGVKIGDPNLGYVKFGGSEQVKLRVVGTVNDDIFNGVDDLYGFIQPIDPRFPLIPGVKPSKLPIRDYIIVPYKFITDFGWTRPEGSYHIEPTSLRLYSLSIKFKDPELMMQYAERLSNPFSRYFFFVGYGNKTLIVQKSNVFQVTLTPTSLLPTLISSIMLFNVIIGSIYERRREIHVYSSVGLSPMHVALLFLSETFVYAIIASVIGYLGAMVTNLLLRALVISVGIVTNYASWAVLWAVGASIIATLLPGLFTLQTASRMVTPSLERRWTLKTKPKGDFWSIHLPFQPLAHDAPGIVAFLIDFFKVHEVEHTGLAFIAKQTSTSKTEDVDKTIMSVSSKVFLEPYEAGVSQEAWVDIVIPKGKDVANVILRLHRLTGTMVDWERSNYRFIDGLRKHLLVWRGLPVEKRAEYVKRGRGV